MSGGCAVPLQGLSAGGGTNLEALAKSKNSSPTLSERD